jgi:transcriptional regulator with XRE-family HTH domain
MPQTSERSLIIERVVTDLRRIRLKKGVSQVRLAKMIGSRQTALSKVESRTTVNVSFPMLCRIASALGYDLEIVIKERTVK